MTQTSHSTGTDPRENPDLSVLVVDDHPAMCSTMQDILEDEGFFVTTASSGEEAIAHCGRKRFDVALMDVQMPEMTGVDAFKAIKELSNQHPRVIFMSAYAVDELKAECYRMGAIAFLQKPLNMQVVIDLVRDRSSSSVLLHLENEKAREELSSTLKNSGYRVVTVADIDEVLINARQISHNFVIVEKSSSEKHESSLEDMLGEISPVTNFILVDSSEDAAQILERISESSLKPKHPFSSGGGWFIAQGT